VKEPFGKKRSKHGPNKREESFSELKKLIDEGYERFWNAPHRRKLKPHKVAFGYFDFSGDAREEKEYNEPIDLT